MDSFAEAPDWLVSALAPPHNGLAALLEGHAPGVTGGADTALDVLLDWSDVLDDEPMAALDQASAEWVAARWGSWRPDDSTGAVLIAEAWQRVCDVAVQLDRAEHLRSTLRSRTDERMAYLAPLSQSPSVDPLGRYLAAVGTRQTDASLAPVWWHIARLPEDVPLHHLRYALNGLRWLPASEPADHGRFRPELADFLNVAAESLARVASEGRLANERARRLFLQLGRRALSLYPKTQWWLPYVETLNRSSLAGEWMSELFPDAGHRRENRSGATHQRTAPPVPARRRRNADEHDFMVRGQDLRKRLDGDCARSTPRPATLELAKALIDEQRQHAEQTGNAHPLVQTLCNLATPIRIRRPDLAAAWAREAVDWEPWNRYPWTILTRAVWSGEGAGKALAIAFRAVERVPHQQPTWHELGQVLVELRCLGQAQEVFEAEIERFGENEHGLHSLAVLHLRRGREEDARRLFERVLAAEPGSPYGLTGLAKTLRKLGNAGQAAELLKPYVTEGRSVGARAVRDEYFRATRAEESDTGNRPAEPAPGEDGDAGVLTADDPTTFVHQARLLRRAAVRRGDMTLARAAQELLDAERNDPDVIAERALIDIELGELDEADSLVSGGVERAPGDLPLRYVRGHLAVRAVERDGPAYSRELMAKTMDTLRPLGDLNPAVRPLVEVQAARASLGMVDGEVVIAEQRRRLARLVEWRPTEQREERGWWAERVRGALFGDSAPSDAARISDGTILGVRSQVPAVSRFLDELQEEFVKRVATSV